MRPYSVVLILSILLLSTNCRKKKEIEYVEFYSELFADSLCFNNQMDANELGEDCGGPCEPCYAFDLDCVPVENVFDMEVYSPMPISWVELDSTGDDWIYRAHTADGDYFRFTFSGRPDLSTVYTMVNWPDEAGEVDIDWVIPPGTVKNVVGLMYPFYEDGHYTFKACDASVILSDDVATATEFNITF